MPKQNEDLKLFLRLILFYLVISLGPFIMPFVMGFNPEIGTFEAEIWIYPLAQK